MGPAINLLKKSLNFVKIVSVQLFASVERFFVSRLRDFFLSESSPFGSSGEPVTTSVKGVTDLMLTNTITDQKRALFGHFRKS